MKKFFAGVVLIIALVFLAAQISKDQSSIKSAFVDKDKSTSQTKIDEKLIFVPYWTLEKNKDISDYNTLIYFGVAANEEGIIEDPGTKNIDDFLKKAGNNQKKLLTLRLVDHDTNSKILDDEKIQSKIINETIDFAKKNNFDGIVIDFETKSIGFEEVTQQTSNFIISSLQKIKQNNLEAHTLLFGDTYYRARAFDVAKIAKASDSIMIMAYDFHKSRGNPGPTFPTTDKEKYGYDFESMLKDFAKEAKPGKTTVILGMFGYDWKIDGHNSSKEPAVPVTLGEAEMIFLNSCEKNNCHVFINEKTGEAKISYTQDKAEHIVWVETDKSKDKKIEILEKNGISKVGFWAYSFF